ncbi:phosphonate C-P lyase system protein PhnL [Vibrio genomosp. F10 str. 9ZC157]|uniref:Phosphonate C-P lyase system protein PhnL n=1 Tax=Vibrio genomosp. F10 str. ZF-129 TaxID=1187848 RepID=A0A1E5BLD0_9VIBR|nr:ATP-binding cassette domain-containing protein [Vibrio genomosp. F10]OEE38144.1 phosphonate C-P lyase system protein PhnL [Vibrio genomosp. F10 str. ZF-129]OEE97077.1 phosphonate C-P lyase system protein PhnL [Vibrio genomosp. F10 str. 9ZC157]
MNTMLSVSNVSKTFVLHNQSGAKLPVLTKSSFSVDKGECVVLLGRSGSGKSTLLRALYANYLVDEGHIWVRHNGVSHVRDSNAISDMTNTCDVRRNRCEHQATWVDIANAQPREVLEVRQNSLGWVSQFLRVIPRISALDVVAQPLIEQGVDKKQAKQKAAALLTRLNVPEPLWSLAPATFSGGEQQRVNIARGFIVDSPILLLDEPTASLDEKNCQVVIELIQEAKQRGAAIVGIFHDEFVRQSVADKYYDISTATLRKA